MNRSDIQQVIDELSEIDGVRVALAVKRDGTTVPNLVVGEDEELLGALSGAIFATINRSMQRTGLGELEDLLLTAGEGSIQAVAAGDIVLIVLAERAANLGLIRLGLKRSAQALTDSVRQEEAAS